jgi:hypothetical protein
VERAELIFGQLLAWWNHAGQSARVEPGAWPLIEGEAHAGALGRRWQFFTQLDGKLASGRGDRLVRHAILRPNASVDDMSSASKARRPVTIS